MPDEDPSHLSRISTKWSVVRQAHLDGGSDQSAAKQETLDRYSAAIHRYALGALRDADAADELLQEFSIRFLNGKLSGADPERGRFRDFVKGALFHMIADYHRRRAKEPRQLVEDLADVEDPLSDMTQAEQAFTTAWRDQLLETCWTRLEKLERDSGKPYFTALKYRTSRPEITSHAIAQEFRIRLGEPFSSAGVRQIIHRARERFAEYLIEEVLHSLADPTAEDVEQELADLELLTQCQDAFQRWKQSFPPKGECGT